MKEVYRSKITDSGRIVIPAELRRELGMSDGQDVLFVREDSALKLMSAADLLRQVQETVRKYIPDDSLDLTDELLQERKADASLR
jgi:AbrB family looped-hinge helix DNA binding protein